MYQKIEKETNPKTNRGNVPEALRRRAEQKAVFHCRMCRCTIIRRSRSSFKRLDML